MKAPKLQSFRLKNFKAIRDSGIIRFNPLTVLIGNNGSGKSSLIEGLETLQMIVEEGLDGAMQHWRGFEHAWYKGESCDPRLSASLDSKHLLDRNAAHKLTRTKEGRNYYSNQMSFLLRGKVHGEIRSFSAKTEISLGPGGNELFFLREEVKFKNWYQYNRDSNGKVKAESLAAHDSSRRASSNPFPVFLKQLGGRSGISSLSLLSDDESLLEESLDWFISSWQFVSFIPQNMGEPIPQKRTGGDIRLKKDGSNIAEYLADIRNKDIKAFNGIIETLQYVLPYARDLQPALTSELERAVYLQLTESTYKVPGWLLSTGTLRILAILALLRHPTPPPVIIIEEIENGLDPRTINLIVDEIRNAVESGRTQVILTTHSPYLLDLLLLPHIVLVERIDAEPIFTRPADSESLKEWAKKFGPGRLYTMDLLGGEKGK